MENIFRVEDMCWNVPRMPLESTGNCEFRQQIWPDQRRCWTTEVRDCLWYNIINFIFSRYPTLYRLCTRTCNYGSVMMSLSEHALVTLLRRKE